MNFSLATDSWVPVLRGGAPELASLRTLLTDAHELSLSQSDGPAFASVLRLATALTLDVLGSPRSAAGWGELYRQGRFDPGTVTAYLDKYEHRFGLFDRDHPFMQSADTIPDKRSPVTKLVPAIATGNNPPLTSPYTDAHPKLMSAAEAALALVTGQAYSAVNIGRPKALDAKTASGNFGGRAGVIGFTAPVGATLFETLMMNLPVGLDLSADMPVWRRDDHPSGRRERLPLGPMDVLTWTSRRVLLLPDDDGSVSWMYYGGGDTALGDLSREHELHTAWKVEKDCTRPVFFQARMAGWRGLRTVLALRTAAEGTEPSLLISQLKELVGTVLPDDHPISVAVVGVVWGTMMAKFDDVVHDSYPIPLAALSGNGDSGLEVLYDLVDTTEAVRRSLYTHSANVYQLVNRCDRDVAGAYATRVCAAFLGSVDEVTRRFLSGYSRQPERWSEATVAWRSEVRRIAGEQMSRVTSIIGGERAFDSMAVKEEYWMRHDLSKILPAEEAA